MRNRYGALLCLLSLGMLPSRATGQGGALADLPLHLLPAPGAGPLLAVILSGDYGIRIEARRGGDGEETTRSRRSSGRAPLSGRTSWAAASPARVEPLST